MVPLLVSERRSDALRERYREDPLVVVWWPTEIECVSAISRLERDGELTARAASRALALLDTMTTRWQEIEPSSPLRRSARRLLRVHALRAADALQLAAATVAAEGDPTMLEIVTVDRRVSDAGRLEGFSILGGD